MPEFDSDPARSGCAHDLPVFALALLALLVGMAALARVAGPITVMVWRTAVAAAVAAARLGGLG